MANDPRINAMISAGRLAPGNYDYMDGILQRLSDPISPDGLYPMPGAQAVQGADGLYPMPGAQAVQGVDGLYPMPLDRGMMGQAYVPPGLEGIPPSPSGPLPTLANLDEEASRVIAAGANPDQSFPSQADPFAAYDIAMMDNQAQMAGPSIPGARMSDPTAAPLPGPGPVGESMARAGAEGRELQRMLDNVLTPGVVFGVPTMPRMGADAGYGLGAMDMAQPASPGGSAKRGKPASKMQRQVLSTFGGDMGEYNRWYNSLPEADRKKITNWSKAARYMEQNPGSMMSREPGSAPVGPSISMDPGAPNMSIETAPILGGGEPATSTGPRMSIEPEPEMMPPPVSMPMPPPTPGPVFSMGGATAIAPDVPYSPFSMGGATAIAPDFSPKPTPGSDGLYPMLGDRAVQGADGYYPMPGQQAVQGADGYYPALGDRAVQGADGYYPMPGQQAVQDVDGLWPMGSPYGMVSPMTPALPMRQDLVTPRPCAIGTATPIAPAPLPSIDLESIMGEQMPPPSLLRPSPEPPVNPMGTAQPIAADPSIPGGYVSDEEQQRRLLQRYLDEALKHRGPFTF